MVSSKVGRADYIRRRNPIISFIFFYIWPREKVDEIRIKGILKNLKVLKKVSEASLQTSTLKENLLRHPHLLNLYTKEIPKMIARALIL